MSEKILPIPYTERTSVLNWFQKLNEELDIFKAFVLVGTTPNSCIIEAPQNHKSQKYNEYYEDILAVAVNLITDITSMLESMGIDEQMRQEEQRRVNERNREKG